MSVHFQISLLKGMLFFSPVSIHLLDYLFYFLSVYSEFPASCKGIVKHDVATNLSSLVISCSPFYIIVTSMDIVQSFLCVCDLEKIAQLSNDVHSQLVIVMLLTVRKCPIFSISVILITFSLLNCLYCGK